MSNINTENNNHNNVAENKIESLRIVGVLIWSYYLDKVIIWENENMVIILFTSFQGTKI